MNMLASYVSKYYKIHETFLHIKIMRLSTPTNFAQTKQKQMLSL